MYYYIINTVLHNLLNIIVNTISFIMNLNTCWFYWVLGMRHSLCYLSGRSKYLNFNAI